MKKYKRLNLLIDGTSIHTSPIELPENGKDIECPACLHDEWIDVYSIIQHGFDREYHLDILECEYCGNYYHCQYELEFSEVIVKVDGE